MTVHTVLSFLVLRIFAIEYQLLRRFVYIDLKYIKYFIAKLLSCCKKVKYICTFRDITINLVSFDFSRNRYVSKCNHVTVSTCI